MDDQLGKARVRGLGPGTRPGADTPVAQNDSSKMKEDSWVGARHPKKQCPEFLQKVSRKHLSLEPPSLINSSNWMRPIFIISTVGALSIGMTGDNHPIPSNPLIRLIVPNNSQPFNTDLT